METFNFSNSNIDLACEEVGKFLASAGGDRREALCLKRTFEEVLLEYQSKFGEDATMMDVADSLDMLDKETLHKNN